MPIVFEKSLEKLQSESISELLDSTNITRTTPGSKARSMLQVFNRKLNKAYQDFDINFLRTFLPFAQGRFLDYIGDMLNVPRLGGSRATVTTGSQLFKVTVKTTNLITTFGDLNNGNDILLPVGTVFSTLPQNEGVVYKLSEAIVLSASSNEAFLSIEAVKDGSFSNLSANTLRFTTFADYASGTGLVFSNPGVINTGQEIESDTNYRFRISNQSLSAEAANQTALRLALLVIPGVSDLVAIPYSRGIGTFDYLIQTIIPNTPDPVIQACQSAINFVQGHGIDGRAVRPRLTGMTFTLSVTWRNDASASDREAIKRNIVTAIQDYVNNLKIGEEFIYNELIQRILDVDTKIKNIGTANKAIDEIFVYRESKLKDNLLKELLIADYSPEEDERVIIEESVLTPVIILDKN
jgi:uncharacterized phage protein gp47/JayE